MSLLRRIPADIWAGLRSGPRACRDLLLWGHVYPSHYPVRVTVPPATEES
jgi:hypothetical protein